MRRHDTNCCRAQAGRSRRQQSSVGLHTDAERRRRRRKTKGRTGGGHHRHRALCRTACGQHHPSLRQERTWSWRQWLGRRRSHGGSVREPRASPSAVRRGRPSDHIAEFSQHDTRADHVGRGQLAGPAVDGASPRPTSPAAAMRATRSSLNPREHHVGDAVDVEKNVGDAGGRGC